MAAPPAREIRPEFPSERGGEQNPGGTVGGALWPSIGAGTRVLACFTCQEQQWFHMRVITVGALLSGKFDLKGELKAGKGGGVCLRRLPLACGVSASLTPSGQPAPESPNPRLTLTLARR